MSTFWFKILEDSVGRAAMGSIRDNFDSLTKCIKITEKSAQSCKTIVDKAAEMDINLSTAPSYTIPKPALEARDQIQPLVELCKTSLSTRETLSQSLDKMETCFGLDDSFWGTYKNLYFIATSLYLYDAEPIMECSSYYVVDPDKHLETIASFKNASVALSEYAKEHEYALNSAGQMLIEANFDFAA